MHLLDSCGHEQAELSTGGGGDDDDDEQQTGDSLPSDFLELARAPLHQVNDKINTILKSFRFSAGQVQTYRRLFLLISTNNSLD